MKKAMSPRFLAEVIKRNKNYHGQRIRLLSCNTGKPIEGDYCFAEELASILGREVLAPNDFIYFDLRGNYKIGEFGEGKMILYKPNERRRLK